MVLRLLMFIFILVTVLFFTNLVLIFLGENKIGHFGKNLDVYYFIGAFLGIGLMFNIIEVIFAL